MSQHPLTYSNIWFSLVISFAHILPFQSCHLYLNTHVVTWWCETAALCLQAAGWGPKVRQWGAVILVIMNSNFSLCVTLTQTVLWFYAFCSKHSCLRLLGSTCYHALSPSPRRHRVNSEWRVRLLPLRLVVKPHEKLTLTTESIKGAARYRKTSAHVWALEWQKYRSL